MVSSINAGVLHITLGGANVHIELRAYCDDRFTCISIGNYERRFGRWRPVVPETPDVVGLTQPPSSLRTAVGLSHAPRR